MFNIRFRQIQMENWNLLVLNQVLEWEVKEY